MSVERGYLQAYVPAGSVSKYSSDRSYFSGLDKRLPVDSGVMSEVLNVDAAKLPLVEGFKGHEEILTGLGTVLGCAAYGDKLIAVAKNEEGIHICLVDEKGNVQESAAWDDEYTGKKRSVVVYHGYKTTGDADKDGYTVALDAEDYTKILVFPDRKVIDISDRIGEVKSLVDEYPVFDYATVFLSRIFGMRGSMVMATGASTYENWVIDTPEVTGENGVVTGGYDEAHAWYSTTDAAIGTSGEVKGIVAYQDHPIIFKDDCIQQINNNKNPFRIQDIEGTGTVDGRSICEVSGTLMFVGKDNVYAYGGGYPVEVGSALGDKKYSFAVCGGYADCYYVYTGDETSEGKSVADVYCLTSKMWSRIELPCVPEFFITLESGLYVLSKDGKVHKVCGGDDWLSWHFETELIAHGTANVKRPHKMQALVTFGDEGSKFCMGGVKEDGSFDKYKEATGKENTKGVRVATRMRAKDVHKFRFEGTGGVKMHFAEVVYSEVGERYV